MTLTNITEYFGLSSSTDPCKFYSINASLTPNLIHDVSTAVTSNSTILINELDGVTYVAVINGDLNFPNSVEIK